MPPWRKTAVVHFELPSGADEGSLPLAVEREFHVTVTIDGRPYPAHSFHSPINDEQWREFIGQLRNCNGTDPITGDRPSQKGNRDAAAIRALARKLYESIVQVSPALRDFLSAAGTPRRLVIETTRPELHLLPWAGMYDETGHLLAAADLSVVQCWQDFASIPAATGGRLRLLKVVGQDTNQRTQQALAALASTPELEQVDVAADFQQGAFGDILHLEKHGDAVQNTTGGVDPNTLAGNFPNLKLALLWSCYSASANSWGDSPALNLHRNSSGATLVLSFLAELNNDDAGSISAAFYSDVFGPAASRDPESALLRIRCAKAANELGWANWASMTVFLRQPLDMSALPLNGPRVPAAAWLPVPPSTPAPITPADTAALSIAGAPPAATPAAAAPTLDPFWQTVADQVAQLQPGSRKVVDPAALAGILKIDPTQIRYDKLPAEAFTTWRGNVIRISEPDDAVPDDATLEELGIAPPDESAQPATHSVHVTDPADRISWFFSQIARFGSPLIVWTDAAPRHLKFLETTQPPSTLSFLLLFERPLESPSLMELVDENRLDAAFDACKHLPDNCGDNELAAAYWACIRGEQPDHALPFIARIQSVQERLLLMGNYVSRGPKTPLSPELIRSVGEFRPGEEPSRPEDFYRLAIDPPPTTLKDGTPSLRETARARHELAYALEDHGQTETAEMLMHQAVREIEASGKDPAVRKDSRWYFALSATLRDLADLLAANPERLEESKWFLQRAMSIQSFHGMRLELAYSTSTAAKIALAACHYTRAIDSAVDAANLFESCNNWRGWYGAISILFDALAETRETARVLSLVNIVNEKLQLSNLSEDRLAANRRDLSFQRARAHWIGGNLPEATKELQTLSESASLHKKDPRVERLYSFLRITLPAPVDPAGAGQ